MKIIGILAGFAAVVAVGCGGGGTPAPVTATSLTDDFSGGFSATNWKAISGTPTVDADQGNPAPSLALASTSNSGTSEIQSQQQYSTTNGETFAVDVGFPGSTQPSPMETATVVVGGNSVIATFMITPTQVTYILNSGGSDVRQNTVPNDTAWHHYAVVFSDVGGVNLTRDGTSLLGLVSSSNSGAYLQLQDAFQGNPGAAVTRVARFDNVSITHP